MENWFQATTAILNEVLSLNAQESPTACGGGGAPHLLNEVLSLNAQESDISPIIGLSLTSSMKS